jgi:transposase
VQLCQQGDRSIGQVAKDFDLTETAVREWVRQAELDAGYRDDGLTSDERAELAAVRRENRRLREDVEILKRAPRVHAELRDQGRRHSRKRMARLMRHAAVAADHPRPRRSSR